VGEESVSDIKLFRIQKETTSELQGDAADLEKPLQNLIERNLESLLGIRFLATEYLTGKTHLGRIDTLGLDENDCPVILEYKRSVGENVINQGLFYLDWLMDHQAEFRLLVMKVLGKQASEHIDWSAPRLICIASDFTRYDSHAVQQIDRSIELIRYRRFGDDLLLLELVNAAGATGGVARRSSGGKSSRSPKPASPGKKAPGKAGTGGDKSFEEWLQDLAKPQLQLLASIEDYITSLGDDVQTKQLRLYRAFKRLKNFATLVPQQSRFLLYLHLKPKHLSDLPGNARDVTDRGHWGTGDLELSIAGQADLEAAKPLIQRAYEGRSNA
jgi:predicted transport protein